MQDHRGAGGHEEQRHPPDEERRRRLDQRDRDEPRVQRAGEEQHPHHAPGQRQPRGARGELPRAPQSADHGEAGGEAGGSHAAEGNASAHPGRRDTIRHGGWGDRLPAAAHHVGHPLVIFCGVSESLTHTRRHPITSPSSAIPLLLAAARFAAEKHEQQRRKGGDQVPYINHPIGVAHLLTEIGGVTDPEVLAAALLHDTIEDTDTTDDELRACFGDRITALVLELTDDKGLEQAERKERQVRDVPHKSAEARCIKLADKASNVHDIAFRPPANWSWARRAEYLDWAERVVRACGATNPALERHFAETLAAGRAQLDSERSSTREAATGDPCAGQTGL